MLTNKYFYIQESLDTCVIIWNHAHITESIKQEIYGNLKDKLYDTPEQLYNALLIAVSDYFPDALEYRPIIVQWNLKPDKHLLTRDDLLKYAF